MVKTKVLDACHMKEAQKEVANARFISYLLATGKLSVLILPKRGVDSENKNSANKNQSGSKLVWNK